MTGKVLIVDDEMSILLALERKLFGLHAVFKADNGIEGLKTLVRKGPFAVIITDYKMPQMNGLQLLEEAARAAPETVRVMLTGHADIDIAMEAINKGNIFRFLTKPCGDQELLQVVSDAVKQYQLVTAERELLQNTLTGSIRLLTDLFSAVQPDSFARAGNISRLAKRVAVRAGITKTWEIEMAAFLSQIGTITLPSELIDKKQSGIDLTEPEEALYNSHPQIGSKLLANIPRLEDIAKAIEFQFRGFDGSGPPTEELQGEKIPLLGRILKLVQDYNFHFEIQNIAMRSLKKLKHSSWLYDPKLLAALEAEILNIEDGFQYVVRHASISELAPGMILADNLYDYQGAILIPRGTMLNEVLKTRLINYTQVGKIEEPLKVIIKVRSSVRN